MKNERIWSYVKETTSHLQNKLTKIIHLGVATRSSTKWDCLKPIWFHQYTWGLQHFLTFLQEDIGHIKCYWFKISLHHLPNFWQEPYSFMHICRQWVYYNCVKFHLNPTSRLGGVALTSPSLHTERISEYKLNYPPFQILDSNHIPSCTSAGSVLQLCSFIKIQ